MINFKEIISYEELYDGEQLILKFENGFEDVVTLSEKIDGELFCDGCYFCGEGGGCYAPMNINGCVSKQAIWLTID